MEDSYLYHDEAETAVIFEEAQILPIGLPGTRYVFLKCLQSLAKYHLYINSGVCLVSSAFNYERSPGEICFLLSIVVYPDHTSSYNNASSLIEVSAEN